MTFKTLSFVVTAFLLSVVLSLHRIGEEQPSRSTTFQQQKKMNVLFIAIDDLRPELGCYGNELAVSPNIDQLADEGLLFERAYCQQAVCSPSRTSLLTGLRPDSTHVYDLTTHFRNTVPNVITLPQHFKNNGYYTTWWGKIFHAALLDSISWTQQGKRLEPEDNWRAYVRQDSKEKAARNKGGGPAFEMADVPDNAYPDGQIADNAIKALHQIKDRPFFLAVGFYKPHLPFNAPKKYWDLYDPADFKLPDHRYPPENAPVLASTNFGELRAYYGIPQKGDLTEEQALQLIHGYHACVSYTDAQIGRLLQELKALGLDKNTIVVLWGDHGWKLADYGQWCKHTNFEIDTRAPLIVKVPGMKTKGRKTKALVEFVDIYPSLCELAGLPQPEHLQGDSFVPLLSEPDLSWKNVAISQYPREKEEIMGYSIRTDRYRYTRWQRNSKPKKVIALELYDLHKDPQGFVNIANQSEYQKVIQQLDTLFRQRK